MECRRPILTYFSALSSSAVERWHDRALLSLCAGRMAAHEVRQGADPPDVACVRRATGPHCRACDRRGLWQHTRETALASLVPLLK